MTLPCLAITIRDGVPSPAIPLRYVYDAQAVVTRVALRLYTQRGTWPTDVNFGLDHYRLSLPNVSAVEVEALVRRQVAAEPGVIEIQSVDLTWPGPHRAITVRILVESPEGPVLATVGDLGTFDGYAPGTWYILGRVSPIVPGRV